ncbi:MAG: hypothetical protein JRJ79_16565, partial [Deltaproteobacteria bacterium]|nr:hypothetical protein [Deltaproteobacteria bacterium]
TAWVTPTPRYDPAQREEVQSFCLQLLEWLDLEAQLIAEDNAFQEQLASGGMTPALRSKPAELQETSSTLYQRARDLPRPPAARSAHDKLLELAGGLADLYLLVYQMSERYSEDLYRQYSQQAQEVDRLFYSFYDEVEDLFLLYDIDPSDCTLVYRTHYPLVQTYTNLADWYPGPGPRTAHRNIQGPPFVALTVKETDQLYIASFAFVKDTTEVADLNAAFEHLEDVLTYLLPSPADAATVVDPIPRMLASFEGEEVLNDTKVAGLPIRTVINYLDPGKSMIEVYVVVPK